MYPILSLFLMLPLLHIIKGEGRVEKESRVQRSIHKLYAILEPKVLRLLNKMLESKFFTENRLGRMFMVGLAKALWFLPHGIVIDYWTAEKIIRMVAETGKGHIAIGPCVCKKALGVNDEPYITDMTILYGAEIYTELHGDEYRELTPEEALRLLKEFEKYGLIHEVFACLKDEKWTFVICNCDIRYCVPTKAYIKTGNGIYPGPYRAVVDAEKCLGVEECGICLEICKFNAIEARNGKAYVNSNCMGCGLCIDSCKGNARRLVKRENYKSFLLPVRLEHEHK